MTLKSLMLLAPLCVALVGGCRKSAPPKAEPAAKVAAPVVKTEPAAPAQPEAPWPDFGAGACTAPWYWSEGAVGEAVFEAHHGGSECWCTTHNGDTQQVLVGSTPSACACRDACQAEEQRAPSHASPFKPVHCGKSVNLEGAGGEKMVQVREVGSQCECVHTGRHSGTQQSRGLPRMRPHPSGKECGEICCSDAAVGWGKIASCSATDDDMGPCMGR